MLIKKFIFLQKKKMQNFHALHVDFIQIFQVNLKTTRWDMKKLLSISVLNAMKSFNYGNFCGNIIWRCILHPSNVEYALRFYQVIKHWKSTRGMCILHPSTVEYALVCFHVIKHWRVTRRGFTQINSQYIFG